MANRNRTAGIRAEQQIVRELKELGFDKVVTTRLESKRMDDLGVDVIQLPDPSIPLPCYLQIKKTLQTPSVDLLKVDVGKPLAIIYQKQQKKGSRFYTSGEYAIMDKDLFYKLLKYVYSQLRTVRTTEEKSD